MVGALEGAEVRAKLSVVGVLEAGSRGLETVVVEGVLVLAVGAVVDAGSRGLETGAVWGARRAAATITLEWALDGRGDSHFVSHNEGLE